MHAQLRDLMLPSTEALNLVTPWASDGHELASHYFSVTYIFAVTQT